jgi:SAM-dependent methyltransferase
LFLSKNKSVAKNLSKKSAITKKQNQHLNETSEKVPHFEKLDPEIYSKLQSTIREVIEKTLPEYKEWLNSAFGEKIIDNDYSNRSLQNVDRLVISAVKKAMKTAIPQALKEYGDQQGIMEKWFKMKFYDDVSDIRPESRAYYKYCVENFVTEFFTKEKVAGKWVFDFGCGPGYFSTILSKLEAHVTGIDRSAFLIGKANELKQRIGLENVEFLYGDFLDFAKNMPSEKFDYIIAIDTIVSFDYCRQTHNHKDFTQTLSEIRRVMKDAGRFFIIEAHPFFGQLAKGITLSKEGRFHGCLPNYKIAYKANDNPHHWFTLDEMTSALSENGLAICRIYEPDPSVELEKENPHLYRFYLKYPMQPTYYYLVRKYTIKRSRESVGLGSRKRVQNSDAPIPEFASS